jgi:protein MpaA
VNRRRRWYGVAAAIVVAAGVWWLAAGGTDRHAAAPPGAAVRLPRRVSHAGSAPHAGSAHQARSAPQAGSAPRNRSVPLGRSARGRPITGVELGDPRLPTGLLVVGCIHGNECAGTAVARLVEAHPPPRVHAWVIEDLNPDGRAADTRANAQRVDLNRNFPWRWQPLSLASGQYSGPRALSAPESRIAYSLIQRVRPRVSVWFHQPLGVVDESGGDLNVERRFALLAGMPLRRLTRYPGSATGWEDRHLPGTTAFVVELSAGRLAPATARRLAQALRTLVERSSPAAHG